MVVEYPPFKPIRLVLLLVLLIGGAVVAVKFPGLRQRYQDWHRGSSFEQAKKFAAEKDYPNATLALSNALAKDPANPDMCRLAADLLEQSGNIDAVAMRKRVAQLAPGQMERRYELVRTALRFDDEQAAREAIEDLPPEERTSPSYRRATAALALAAGRTERAEAILTNISGLPAEDVTARLERAFVLLRKAGAAEVEAARRELLESATREDMRALALRELTMDAGRRRDLAKAEEFARQLTEVPKPAYRDKLLLANVLLSTGKTTLDEQLPPLQAEALARPEEISQLVAWLLTVDQAARALAWLQGLAPDQKESPEVLTALANCHMALHAWAEVPPLIARGAFGQVPPDAIQLALAARVLQGMNRTALLRSLWDEAVRATEDNLQGLLVLHRFATSWGFVPEAQATLLRLAERFPEQIWAHQSLVKQFYEAKDTKRLRAVFRLWDEARPGSTYVQGNRLFLDLLSEPRSQTTALAEKARQLKDREPKNPFAVTNFALSLWRGGHAKEALTELEALPAEALGDPRRALYHGLFLAAVGRAGDSAAALDRVDKDALLPEESDLLRQAREQRKTGDSDATPSPAAPASR